jgi:hypothetical protein
MAAQVNVFGLVSGSYVANFEYMALPWLGAMAEANAYIRDGNTGFNIAAHGRFHVKPQIDSFFVAPFLRYQRLSGDVTENSTDYSFSASVLTTGVNIGKRWIFGPGISIVARVGWGPSMVNTEYDDAEPASSGLVDDLLGIFAGFDGELSAGWAF